MHRICLLLALCGGANLAHAQTLISQDDLDIAAQLRDRALNSDMAYQLLESLTVEVGPRMAGTPGDAAGVAWAKKTFEALDYDQVALEPVTFPLWRRGAESAEVTAPYPQPLAVTALGFSPGTGPQGVEAKVVHFGTLHELAQVEDGSLNGEIVFISNQMERTKTGEGYGPAVVARRDGSTVTAAKGGSAVMIRSVGTDNNRTPHTGTMRVEPGQAAVPAAALSNPDADLLVAMLERGDVTVKLSLDVGIDGEGLSHNVIGDIKGSDKADEFVIIGGHLDSWDLGTGAVDDGFGVAITMAAGRFIAEHAPRPPSRTIRVVAWANEEQGLWGAKAYYEAHKDQLEKHLVGAESDFGAGRVWAFASRVNEAALPVIGQIHSVLEPLGIELGNNAAFGGADVLPLRAAGMPVVSLYQDGSDYFDYHHTANDTLDKVDPEVMRQNFAAWVAFTWLAANYPGTFSPAPVIE